VTWHQKTENPKKQINKNKSQKLFWKIRGGGGGGGIHLISWKVWQNDNL
jgi:hypothetical protein